MKGRKMKEIFKYSKKEKKEMKAQNKVAAIN